MNGFLEFFGSRSGLVVTLGLAVVGAYLLWTHTGHVLAALPYLILLACPLLHMFGHGHGRHST
jgi:fucose permease